MKREALTTLPQQLDALSRFGAEVTNAIAELEAAAADFSDLAAKARTLASHASAAASAATKTSRQLRAYL